MKAFSRLEDKGGFTLIELIMIVTIIGVLAAVAIPQFASSRTRSLDASVMADLRSAATVQEAYYLDHSRYSSTVAPLRVFPYNLFTSPAVDLSVVSADIFAYTMVAYHPSASKTYTMSGPGGQILH